MYRFEDLEMSKTRALFELTEERSKVHPRGVDYDLHQTTVQELSITRTRLKDEVQCIIKEIAKKSTPTTFMTPSAQWTARNWPDSSWKCHLLRLSSMTSYQKLCCNAFLRVLFPLLNDICHLSCVPLHGKYTLIAFLAFGAQHWMPLSMVPPS